MHRSTKISVVLVTRPIGPSAQHSCRGRALRLPCIYGRLPLCCLLVGQTRNPCAAGVPGASLAPFTPAQASCALGLVCKARRNRQGLSGAQRMVEQQHVQQRLAPGVAHARRLGRRHVLPAGQAPEGVTQVHGADCHSHWESSTLLVLSCGFGCMTAQSMAWHAHRKGMHNSTKAAHSQQQSCSAYCIITSTLGVHCPAVLNSVVRDLLCSAMQSSQAVQDRVRRIVAAAVWLQYPDSMLLGIGAPARGPGSGLQTAAPCPVLPAIVALQQLCGTPGCSAWNRWQDFMGDLGHQRVCCDKHEQNRVVCQAARAFHAASTTKCPMHDTHARRPS